MIINTSTKLYGVLGFPVKHSRSPLLFNAAFEACSLNGVYVAIEQQNTGAAINAMRGLNMVGMSVTIPHKLEAMKYVDKLDSSAEIAGCLNTIHNDNNVLVGYNYDGMGAVVPLKKKQILDRPIFILGNGGAARGIAFGLLKEGVTQINFIVRNKTNGLALTTDLEKMGVRTEMIPFSDLKKGNLPGRSLIINTTPIGMEPNVGESPLSAEFLNKEMFLYDIVYTPIETQLLKEAKAVGCEVMYGSEMFLGQASLQFKTFTGIDAPIELWRSLIK